MSARDRLQCAREVLLVRLRALARAEERLRDGIYGICESAPTRFPSPGCRLSRRPCGASRAPSLPSAGSRARGHMPHSQEGQSCAARCAGASAIGPTSPPRRASARRMPPPFGAGPTLARDRTMSPAGTGGAAAAAPATWRAARSVSRTARSGDSVGISSEDTVSRAGTPCPAVHRPRCLCLRAAGTPLEALAALSWHGGQGFGESSPFAAYARRSLRFRVSLMPPSGTFRKQSSRNREPPDTASTTEGLSSRYTQRRERASRARNQRLSQAGRDAWARGARRWPTMKQEWF